MDVATGQTAQHMNEMVTNADWAVDSLLRYNANDLHERQSVKFVDRTQKKKEKRGCVTL